MYYASGNYEAFARSEEAGGRRPEIGVYRRQQVWQPLQQRATWCATAR